MKISFWKITTMVGLLVLLGNHHVLSGAAGEVVGGEKADDLSLQSFPPRLVTVTNPIPVANGAFGHGVAGVGSDRVLVGMEGAAYLFHSAGTLLTVYTNPNPAISRFGESVAALGSARVLIGSYGAAYLFNTNGALLTTFTNPAPSSLEEEGNWFGHSVASMGIDRVLIGAPGWGARETGAVYLFGTNGGLVTTITNPTPEPDDWFGFCLVAVGSDRVLIGAPLDSTAASTAGEAYLFSASGTLLTTITNPTPGSGEEFAISVAAFGTDRLLVGADSDNPDYTGGAYLFGTNGVLLTAFTNPAPSANDWFGFSVAAVGTDRVLIGAYLDDFASENAGVAYLFDTNGTWLAPIANPTPVANDGFGCALAALGNDRFIIAAYSDDTGATNAGTVYVFHLEAFNPHLAVTYSSGNLVVSWSRTADGFVLDETISLAPPPAATIWSPVSTAIYQTNTTSLFISVPGPIDNRFYRLRKAN